MAAPKPPAGTEFTREQYEALKRQVASGVQSVQIENKGRVVYFTMSEAIALMDRMERELQTVGDGEPPKLSRRTFYLRR